LGRRDPYVPVIMMTGEPNLSQMPEIVRAGAYDFIAKPVVKDALLAAVARAADKKRLSDEKRRLEDELSRHAGELERHVAERTAELAERSRELAEAHGFLNLILDSSTEYAILALDEAGRIRVFNRGAELLFGYSPAAAVGQHPCELLTGGDPPDDEALRGALKEAEERGRYRAEVRLQRADRTEFPASVTVTPISAADGRRLGHLCVVRDLTAEREAEAALTEMQARLAHQERIAALGRVAAQVAHEVKNPLTGLQLYALHLRQKLAARPGAGELKLVDSIVDTINHLAGTVEQIMSYARPLELAPSEVCFNAVVDAVLELLRPQMDANRVELRARPDDSDTRVRIDESSMRSAIINLVLNAIQAMPEGGRLGVDSARSGDDLILEISDTGVGMTAEQVANMFEPFYTTRSQGLGLGMSYARKVVEHHGGRIEVESRPGAGTRLRVRLPVAAEGRAECTDTKSSSSMTSQASPARSS
jgi:PAS domain S-box-containing protein